MDTIKTQITTVSLFQKWTKLVHSPIDNFSYGLIRICLASALLYLELKDLFSDQWYRDYITNSYHVSYPYLSWIKPFSQDVTIVIQLIFLASTIGLIINYRYRLSAILTWAIYTYFFLISSIQYNNHCYLISMLLLLFAVSPAPDKNHPKCPYWPLLLIQTILIAMYTYAGIAKLTNPDWLRGYQMAIWLSKINPHSLLNHLFPIDLATQIAWFGMLFDLCISPLLLWKKTRKWAFILVITFHMTNNYVLFSQFTGPTIGIFPFVATTCTLLAFSKPESVRKKITSLIQSLFTHTSPSQTKWPSWTALMSIILIPLMIFTLPLSDIRNGFCLPGTWTSDGHLTGMREEFNQSNQMSDIYFRLTIFQFNALRTPPQLTQILKQSKFKHPQDAYDQKKIIIDDTIQDIPTNIKKGLK